MTLHLTVTAGVLLWLHRRRSEGFASLAALLTRRRVTARLAVERTHLGDRVGRDNGGLVLDRG